ncbi:hypothetical protein A2U01_0101394, partial [Trifolium medium]|nr:hypothetical protein [Trifolium medium]
EGLDRSTISLAPS